MANPFADAAKAAMSFVTKPKPEKPDQEMLIPYDTCRECAGTNGGHYQTCSQYPAQPGSTDVDATLTQRGNRYGKFSENSIVYENLMAVFHDSPNWSTLSPSHKHALGNIATKLARMLTGDPNYDDNWRDIAGYATLMVRICNGEER